MSPVLLRLSVLPFTGDVEEEIDKVQSAGPDWFLCLPVRQVTHAGVSL